MISIIISLIFRFLLLEAVSDIKQNYPCSLLASAEIKMESELNSPLFPPGSFANPAVINEDAWNAKPVQLKDGTYKHAWRCGHLVVKVFKTKYQNEKKYEHEFFTQSTLSMLSFQYNTKMNPSQKIAYLQPTIVRIGAHDQLAVIENSLPKFKMYGQKEVFESFRNWTDKTYGVYSRDEQGNQKPMHSERPNTSLRSRSVDRAQGTHFHEK